MDTTIPQSLLPRPSKLPLRTFSRKQAGEAVRFICDTQPARIGIAIKQLAKGQVRAIALASSGCAPNSSDQIIIISLDSDSRPGSAASENLFRNLLNGESGIALVGFDMPQTALFIFRDLGLHVAGVDLVSSCSKNATSPRGLVQEVIPRPGLKDMGRLNDLQTYGRPESSVDALGLRAWLSAVLAQDLHSAVASATRVKTANLQTEELSCLAEGLSQFDRFERLKPTVMTGEFSTSQRAGKDQLSIVNSRYKTKVRNQSQQVIVMTNTNGRTFGGKVRIARGKGTLIKLTGKAPNGDLKKLKVIGKEDPTNSEAARSEFVLRVLEGNARLSSLFTRMLWFGAVPAPSTLRTGLQQRTLNKSQHEVVRAMTGDASLVVVHGPPGTGKTTVISAASEVWCRDRLPVWIVAQSNVAVKNIAEKLLKNNVDFRIIVSEDFYREWHEDLYKKFEEKVIIKLPKDTRLIKDLFGSCEVFLATLCMLSNPGLVKKGVFKCVPVERLVIDEASQINVFDYMHLFAKFQKTLIKVCFFGDPKQLPPFGIDDIPSLKSIFDIPHIRDKAYFLNTQYRMPVPLGNFISKYVYDGKLQSNHKIDSMSCLAFVDAGGTEKSTARSWVNTKEIQAIVHLVQDYYRNDEFCIITPYDAQRNEIEKALKSANLPCDKVRVFNVDSFQGNESEYVLVSVVRSQKPGFLTSLNRTNVMLTRCKKGMIIVSNRSFLQSGGKNTLVGELSRHWEGRDVLNAVWVDWRKVADKSAVLPGKMGQRSSSGVAGHIAPSSKPSASTEPQNIPISTSLAIAAKKARKKKFYKG